MSKLGKALLVVAVLCLLCGQPGFFILFILAALVS